MASKGPEARVDGQVLLQVVFAVVSEKVLAAHVTHGVIQCAGEQDVTLLTPRNKRKQGNGAAPHWPRTPARLPGAPSAPLDSRRPHPTRLRATG